KDPVELISSRKVGIWTAGPGHLLHRSAHEGMTERVDAREVVVEQTLADAGFARDYLGCQLVQGVVTQQPQAGVDQLVAALIGRQALALTLMGHQRSVGAGCDSAANVDHG